MHILSSGFCGTERSCSAFSRSDSLLLSAPPSSRLKPSFPGSKCCITRSASRSRGRNLPKPARRTRSAITGWTRWPVSLRPSTARTAPLPYPGPVLGLCAPRPAFLRCLAALLGNGAGPQGLGGAGAGEVRRIEGNGVLRHHALVWSRWNVTLTCVVSATISGSVPLNSCMARRMIGQPRPRCSMNPMTAIK